MNTRPRLTSSLWWILWKPQELQDWDLGLAKTSWPPFLSVTLVWLIPRQIPSAFGYRGVQITSGNSQFSTRLSPRSSPLLSLHYLSRSDHPVACLLLLLLLQWHPELLDLLSRQHHGLCWDLCKPWWGTITSNIKSPRLSYFSSLPDLPSIIIWLFNLNNSHCLHQGLVGS